MTEPAPRGGFLELERCGRWREALESIPAELDSVQAQRHRHRIEAKQKLFSKVEEVVRGAGGESFISNQGDTVARRGEVVVELAEGVQQIDLPLIFRTVESVREQFEKSFGAAGGEVRIRVYPSRSRLEDRYHRSVLGTPEWAAGVYDGTLRLFVVRETTPPDHALACLVSHELIHLLVDRIAAGRCPRWLDEGLAVMHSQELPPAFEHALDTALGQGKHLPLELLAGRFEVLGEPELVDLAYAEAVAVTEHLSCELGREKLGALLRRFGEVDAEQALAEFSLSHWLIERSWLRAERQARRG